MKRSETHKTGYTVYIGGNRYWHRTYDGAVRRATAESNWHARNVTQVIEVETGRMVWGNKQ